MTDRSIRAIFARWQGYSSDRVLCGARTPFRGGVGSCLVAETGLKQLTETLMLKWIRSSMCDCFGQYCTGMNWEFFQTESGQEMVKCIPRRWVGEPEDLDGALLLLASDASRFRADNTIAVDGGYPVSSL